MFFVTFLGHLLFWTLGGVILCVVVKKVLGDWGSREVHGSPLWSWAMSVCFQGIVFPLTLAAAGFRPIDTSESMDMRRLAMFIFWGYISKDFFFPMNFTFWLHHIACGLCILPVLYMTPDLMVDYGVHSIMVCMEFGSFSNTLVTIYRPQLKWWLSLHFIVMTITNIVPFWLLRHIVSRVIAPVGWMMMVILPVLSFLREKACIEFINDLWPGAKATSSKTKAEAKS